MGGSRQSNAEISWNRTKAPFVKMVGHFEADGRFELIGPACSNEPGLLDSFSNLWYVGVLGAKPNP